MHSTLHLYGCAWFLISFHPFFPLVSCACVLYVCIALMSLYDLYYWFIFQLTLLFNRMVCVYVFCLLVGVRLMCALYTCIIFGKRFVFLPISNSTQFTRLLIVFLSARFISLYSLLTGLESWTMLLWHIEPLLFWLFSFTFMEWKNGIHDFEITNIHPDKCTLLHT